VRNVKVVVEYDGADFYGFQYQPGVPTIQGELERALSKMTKAPVTVYGAGRTDAGVHAAGQVTNFRTDGSIPTERVCAAMNALLPRSISAISAEEVPDDFHARYSAVSRLYRYDILNRPVRSALLARYCWHVPQALDEEAMAEAAKPLVGVHDFAAFGSVERDGDCTVRDCKSLCVERNGDHLIIDIRANAFLRSMVRAIVGTLTDIGLGRKSVSEIVGILDSKDRSLCGAVSPPMGLCLVEVEYENEDG